MERLASRAPERQDLWAWNKHGRHDLAGFDTNLLCWSDALVDDPPPGATGRFRMLAISIRNLRRVRGSMHRSLGGIRRYSDVNLSWYRNYSRRRDRYLDHEFLKEPGGQGPGAELTNNVMAEALVSMDLKRGRRIIDLEPLGWTCCPRQLYR